MTDPLAKVEDFLRGFEGDPLQEGVAWMLDAVRSAQQTIADAISVMAAALPYVEDAAGAADAGKRERAQARSAAAHMRQLIEGTATTDRADAMRVCLARAVLDWPQFDDGEEVDGGDLVDWFGEWRAAAKDLIEGAPDTSAVDGMGHRLDGTGPL